MEAPTSHTPAGESAPLIAFAYLGRQNDRRNLLQLTEGALHITHRGKSRAFSLAYIQHVALEHRKLWLPLIGGGILATLCLLALLQTFSMPFRLLSGVVAGLIMMWWGFRGRMALVVYEQRHRTDFLLPGESAAIPLFVAFTNRLIRRYPAPLDQYCLPVSAQEQQLLQQRGVLQLESPRLCHAREDLYRLRLDDGSFWLVFDPLRMGNRLQWSLQGHEVQAHLQGRISKQEIVEIIAA